jgi:oligoribonuclease
MHFLWIDCEMTGLNPQKDKIIEMACIITDEKFNSIYENSWAFKIKDEDVTIMNEKVKAMHLASGLIEKCLVSNECKKKVEEELLMNLKKYTLEKNVFLAGNSIHFDLAFLRLEFPKIVDFLHYRILDVSSFKIVNKIFSPNVEFKKKKLHRAIDDIRESINELKFYLSRINKNN